MTAIVGIMAVIALFFLIVWLLKWLWNITMPELFRLKQVTYWQAFRLMIISLILLGRPQLGKNNNDSAKAAVAPGVEQSRQEVEISPQKVDVFVPE